MRKPVRRDGFYVLAFGFWFVSGTGRIGRRGRIQTMSEFLIFLFRLRQAPKRFIAAEEKFVVRCGERSIGWFAH
jgi:hypothetical protein